MPFVNDAQRRVCYAQASRDRKKGKKPKWNCKEWDRHTKRGEGLEASVFGEPIGEGLKTLLAAAPMMAALAGGGSAAANRYYGQDQQSQHPTSISAEQPQHVQLHPQVKLDQGQQKPEEQKPAKVKSSTITFQQIRDQLALHEGSREWVYDDATAKRLRPGDAATGNRTVGIGFNMDQGAASRLWIAAGGDDQSFKEVYYGRQKIDQNMIDELFKISLKRAVRAVTNVVPDIKEQPKEVQLVLIDMAFNMGSLSGFPGMVKAVNAGDYARAAMEMRYRKVGEPEETPWYGQVGGRAKTLVGLMNKAAKNKQRAQEPLATESISEEFKPLNFESSKSEEIPKKKPLDPWVELPNTERALERLYLDKGQGKWAHASHPRITVAMATPKRVYRIFVDGKQVGWLDFRTGKRIIRLKGAWTEPRDEGMSEDKKNEMLAYLEKIKGKKGKKTLREGCIFEEIKDEDEEQEKKDDDKVTAADQAKVDAIMKNKSLPETAEKGKAYVVRWANGRGIFALSKKSLLQKWLDKTGAWADIVSIKYGEPVAGSKKKKLKVANSI